MTDIGPIGAREQFLDLVGFMWTPVLVGVIDIIIILFCMFGIHQYRPKFIYVVSAGTSVIC